MKKDLDYYLKELEKNKLQYSIEDYSAEVRKLFDFLIDNYEYKLLFDGNESIGYRHLYSGKNIRINLYFDYRDNFFYFSIIRGLETKFPNVKDKINIKTFLDLAEKYNVGIRLKDLEPDKKQYKDSLKRNAELLKKYGKNILKGKEWF
ncbi:hypothetical protein [Leptospira kmetyi]|uniref:hypothetical protein n=1 Tax=Leptospira kmetyi TaxID=408139 RepID=UPI0014385F16|nr:hypothetical protein [Leptospira kmetyi]